MAHSLAHTSATHASALSKAVDTDALRAAIVADLNLGHLTTVEQDKIVEALGSVLLERATYALLNEVPENKVEELAILADHGSDTLLQQKMLELVPHAPEIIAGAVQEGIVEHKRLVAAAIEGEVAKEPKM